MAQCGDRDLLYDEACLHISNQAASEARIFSLSSDCYQCDYLPLTNVTAYGSKDLIISSVHSISFFSKVHHLTWTRGPYLFGQHGIYGLNFTNSSCSDIFVKQEPENAYLPFEVELIVLISAFLLWAIGTCAGNSNWLISYFQPNYVVDIQADLGTPHGSRNSSPIVYSEFAPINNFRTRLRSLDAFRGITIALMLFVNYGGGRYWIFEHTTWNGLNIADIVFPWFAWIMGVCITLSVRSQLRNCSSRWQVFTHSFHRCLVLISLGLILNSKTTNDLSKLRIPGVLQRLGFSYFIVTWLECLFMRPQNAVTVGTENTTGRIVRWLTVFQDIISSWVQWLVMLVIVGIHFLLTLYLPAGNCPPGYLGPGGLHDHGKFSHCTGGATGYIDRMIFGPNHLYINSTPVKTYETTVPFDPEGILGLLTTSFTVFLGVQAGRILSHYSCSKARIQRWLVWSLICGILGGCLCGWTTEGGLIPINKNLWSLSFVFVTASLAFLALTVLFIIIEHLQWWSGAPFQQCGKNSIFIYVVSQLVKDMLPWTWKPFGDGSSHTEFLIMDSWATSLWILIAVILDIYEIYFII